MRYNGPQQFIPTIGAFIGTVGGVAVGGTTVGGGVVPGVTAGAAVAAAG